LYLDLYILLAYCDANQKYVKGNVTQLIYIPAFFLWT